MESLIVNTYWYRRNDLQRK